MVEASVSRGKAVFEVLSRTMKKMVPNKNPPVEWWKNSKDHSLGNLQHLMRCYAQNNAREEAEPEGELGKGHPLHVFDCNVGQ